VPGIDRSEIGFYQAHSDEVAAAQKWLLTGVGNIPDAVDLACTVNGYERHPDIEGLWPWAQQQLCLLKTEPVDRFSTQDLLDILCYVNRSERFIEGTWPSHADDIEKIVKELVRRVKHRDV